VTAMKNIQEPEIKPSVDSRSMINKGIIVNEDKTKQDELAKYATHFEYISTMISIDDPFFKRNIKNDLLKDKHVTWRAFKTLTPQLV
jgi:hypothetical protein